MVDEDELDEELAALQQEEVDSKLTNTHKISQQPIAAQPQRQQQVKLPDAPKGKVEAEEEEDEDERALRELQAEMGM